MATGRKSGRPKSFDREASLEQALQVFLAKGYQATSLADLLDQMGIARQSLYDTFRSKRDLFLEAFKVYEQQAMAAYQAFLNQPGAALHKVESILGGWVCRATERPFGGCLINAAAVDLGRHDPEIAQMVRAHFDALCQLLARCLQQAVADGELQKNVDVVALARLLVNHCQGMIVMGHAGMSRVVIDDIAGSLLRLLPRT